MANGDFDAGTQDAIVMECWNEKKIKEGAYE
jgi:hypothetical protein